jgi:hypothetical protein
VLFGGNTGLQAVGDTWEWDGTEWAPILAPGSPPRRWVYSMAYDPASALTLFSSGFSDQGEQSGTWAYDGGSWGQVNGSTTAPPPLLTGSLVYDATGGQVMLVCGRVNGHFVTSTWLWSSPSATWSPGPPMPSARAWCAATFDARRGKVLVFGGYTDTGVSSDTLEY